MKEARSLHDNYFGGSLEASSALTVSFSKRCGRIMAATSYINDAGFFVYHRKTLAKRVFSFRLAVLERAPRKG